MPEAAPRVSVIIATRDGARLLREALASLQAQTFADFEAIVVDDGSTDDTRNVVASFDDRFRYFHQPKQGRSARATAGSRERAAATSRSSTTTTSCDPDKLKIQVACLDDDSGVGWVYSSARNVDADARPSPYPDYRAEVSGYIYPLCVLSVPLTVILPTVLVRREVLDGSRRLRRARMDRFEDTDMSRIAKRHAVKAISDPLVDVRAHEGNRMEDPHTVFQSVSYYVGKVFREDTDVSSALLRRRASGFFLHYGLERSGAGRRRRHLSRPFLRCSLRCRRTNVYAAELLSLDLCGNMGAATAWVLRSHRRSAAV